MHQKFKKTNKHCIVLNLDACGISSIVGGGVFAIVANRQHGADRDK